MMRMILFANLPPLCQQGNQQCACKTPARTMIELWISDTMHALPGAHGGSGGGSQAHRPRSSARLCSQRRHPPWQRWSRTSASGTTRDPALMRDANERDRHAVQRLDAMRQSMLDADDIALVSDFMCTA